MNVKLIFGYCVCIRISTGKYLTEICLYIIKGYSDVRWVCKIFAMMFYRPEMSNLDLEACVW